MVCKIKKVNNRFKLIHHNQFQFCCNFAIIPYLFYVDDVEKIKPKVPDKFSDDENVRQEPPVPVERLSDNEQPKDDIKDKIVIEPKPLIPEILKIEKDNNIDNKLIEEAKVAYDSLKRIKSPNEVPDMKEELNVEPVKTDEKINTAQKNDVIAVDAIKKEESELAADKEMSNVETVLRKEELERTLEKHIMEQKEMMQEQKELLKDIEQIKKERELAEKNEIEKQNNQHNVAKKIVENENPVDAAQKPNKIDVINKSVAENLESQKDQQAKVGENEIRNDLSVHDELKQSKIQDSKQPLLDSKLSLNSKLPIDNGNPADVLNQHDDIDSKYSDKNSILSSNSSKVFLDSHVKKSEDHIIRALTKQSNKLSDGNETVVLKNVDKLAVSEEKKDTKKEDKKPFSNPIPIVLKMNNNTKQVYDSKINNLNKSQSNIAIPQRDILEEHLRDKRDVGEGPKNISNKIISETSEHKTNLAVETDTKNESETCDKKVNISVASSVESKIGLNEKGVENLIKTSAYLSQQDSIEHISISSEKNVGGNFVKVKKRDLKALEFDDEDDNSNEDKN